MARTPTATGGTETQQSQHEQARREARERREAQAAEAERERAAQQERTDEQTGPTPGSNDFAVAPSTNPSTQQVTQQGGKPVTAEGQRIREQARKDAEARGGRVALADALNATDPKLKYDDTGALVTEDGKKIALAADASDPDVGWTVQHARREGDDAVAYPTRSTVPDQTFHPDELPDPLAAVRAGQLPQNTEVLNIDPDKFKGKKSLEA